MTDLRRVRDLERVFVSTWPGLEVVHHDGWVLAAAEGVTGRANSATVIELGDRPDERIAAVERWYHERDLPPTFRLTPISAALRPLLTARGYRPWNEGCDVCSARLAAVGVADAVTIESRPSDAWLAFGRFAGAATVVRSMWAQASGPQAYAHIQETSGPIVATGQGMVSDGVMAIYGMSTSPERRGEGLGARILTALEAWALEHGAAEAALQVVIDNHPAQRLYRTRGYAAVYRYDYLQLTA